MFTSAIRSRCQGRAAAAGVVVAGAALVVVAGCALRAADDPVRQLRVKDLLFPIDHADVEKVKGSFAETHNGHAHEAIDILAPRNTPVHAVEDGTIAKLFESKAGGHTIYEYDPTDRFCYYYAHLDHYAEGLHESDPVRRGQVIGFVGTSGDAPPETPHLHFTIFELKAAKHWWQGRAIDPYLVFSQ